MKQKLFRSLRGIYGRILSRSRTNPTFNESTLQKIKLDVKQRVGKTYERRALEIVRGSEEKQEWKLNVVKHADYTSFDSYRLSEDFITLIYDKKSCKCTLVLADEVLRFKMRNRTDRCTLVEFVRANLESKAVQLSGTLLKSPRIEKKMPVRIYFKGTTLVILDKNSRNILVHKSLESFETFSCKQRQKEVTFEWNDPHGVSEVWAVRTDVFVGHLFRRVPNHLPIPPPPNFVPTPPQLFTDV